MNRKERIMSALNDITRDISMQNIIVKNNEDGTIEISIKDIELSKGCMFVAVDKTQDVFTASMDYSSEESKLHRVMKSKDVKEMISIICKVLDSHNLEKINIRQHEIIENALTKSEFNKYFRQIDDLCSPPYFTYLNNVQTKLSRLRDTIDKLTREKDLISHVLHEVAKDERKERYWIKLFK